jgi:hypothetical protein
MSNDLFRTGLLNLALGRAQDHQERDNRDHDGRDEDRPPADELCHSAAEYSGQARATPRADRPHRNGALPSRSIPIRLHQRHRCWHDARRGEALDCAPGKQQRQSQSAYREDEQQGAHDAESYADQRDLDAADSVGEATRQDDEQPGKQGSNRDGEIHRSGVDEPRANVLHYRRSDSPRSAGEEPEGDDSEDEAEEELVSPLVARRWSSRSCACHGSLLLKERQGSHDGRLGTGLQRRLHDWAEER